MFEFNNNCSEVREKGVEIGRLNNSAELIRHPIEEGGIGYDKIYIEAAGVERNGSEVVIRVDSSDPTVVFDQKLKGEYGLENSPTVNDLRSGNGEKKLISGGTWIWITDNDGQEYLSLMRRGTAAPTDKNCLTGPAGRCGERLSRTSVDETNQEFILVVSDGVNNENKMLVFYRGEEDKEDLVCQKIRQVGEVFRTLIEKNEKTGDKQSRIDADFLRDNIGIDDFQLLRMGIVSSEGLDTVIMKIDGEEVDRVHGIAYMDEEHNTLEVREVINLVLPQGVSVVKFLNGEKFLNPTQLVKKEELPELLNNELLVPALRNYIEMLVKKGQL